MTPLATVSFLVMKYPKSRYVTIERSQMSGMAGLLRREEKKEWVDKESESE